MNKTIYSLAAIFAIITGCSRHQAEPSFSNKGFKPETCFLTPETMWKYGRISDVSVSPDHQKILYTVAYTNIAENKSYTDLYLTTIDGAQQQITNTKNDEFSALWRPDGNKIGYLSSETGEEQLWEINTDGSDPKQVTNIKGGITNFKYSPDGAKLLFTARVKMDSTVNDLYPDLPLANARIENDIMYRHWDEWSDYTYSHIFITDYKDGETVGEPIDIMKGEKFESPMKPNEEMS
jgi:dipeptidyl aminopeptidase/acylaminoacyl peptidase